MEVRLFVFGFELESLPTGPGFVQGRGQAGIAKPFYYFALH